MVVKTKEEVVNRILEIGKECGEEEVITVLLRV